MPAKGETGLGIMPILAMILIVIIVAIIVFTVRYNKQHPRIEGDKTRGSIGYGFLSFFVPVVGFVLFLVWREKEPGNSKVSGIGALIGLIFWPVVSIVLYLVAFNILMHY